MKRSTATRGGRDSAKEQGKEERWSMGAVGSFEPPSVLQRCWIHFHLTFWSSRPLVSSDFIIDLADLLTRWCRNTCPLVSLKDENGRVQL